MLYRVLALSLCLHLTRACVPVRPGEDMPCPSLPLAPRDAVKPAFFGTGLDKSRFENGAKVYYCDAGQFLIELDGTMAKMLPATATITCKPNSGIFTREDGSAVGSKRYTCGETLVPCDPFPKFTMTTPIMDVKAVDPVPTTAANGDTTWACTAPAKMYKVPGDDGTAAVLAPAGMDFLTCKAQSMPILVGGTTAITPGDTYTCGTLECLTCKAEQIVDKTNAACNTLPNIFCTGKPTTTNDGNGCPILNCGTDNLYHIDSTTATFVPVSSPVMCDKGTWKWGTRTVAASDIGFVCGKAATCIACGTKVGTTYTNMDVQYDSATFLTSEMKPTCEYQCPVNHLLLVGTAEQSKVVCRMDTEKVTAGSETGQELTTTNQFKCMECMCMEVDLTNGEMGLCPKGSLCAIPTPTAQKEQCEATCPMDSSPIYLDATGSKKTSTTIKCVGALWIDANMDEMAGVTCEYAANKGYTTVPPTTPQCTDLTAAPKTPCPGGDANCDPSQLIYTGSTLNGYTLMCKKGTLIHSVATTPGMDLLTVMCMNNGWQGGITSANCVTDMTQVEGCLTAMTGVTGMVEFSCDYGVCFMNCKNNLQFQYTISDVPPKVEKNKYLKCILGEPTPVKAGLIDVPDVPGIMCVA